MFASKDVFLTPPATGGYTIGKSVRLRSSASAYFNRTPASAGSAQKFTMSCWVKLGSSSQTSGQITLLNAGNGTQTNSGNDAIQLRTNGTALQINCLGQSGTGGNYAQFSAVLRDYAAWYHIVVALDTTQATQSNRCRAYINGVEQTSYVANGFTSSYSFTYLNQVYAHLIGQQNEGGGPIYTDAYLTEYNFISGQQLTASSFGSTNAITGVWQPANYTGTYGTNGFYLNFSSNGSSAALGTDFSGNSNTWTVNNISVTAGTTYDSMTDVPTLTSATAANYAVWNTLDKGTVTVTNGNLTAVPAASGTHAIRGAIGLPTSGKWYWETTVNGLGYGTALGIASSTSDVTTGPSSAETRTFQWGSWFNTYNSGVVQYGTNQAVTGGTNWSSASQLAASDVLMIAVDMTNGSMWVGKNGTWFNTSGTANPATNTDPRWTGLSGTTWFPYMSGYGTTSPVTSDINFGQRPFSYTAPTGYVALNTYNLPAGTITTSGTFTGNASTDGPFVYLNGVPTAMTINGNAVTFGTNADHLANGFKVRSSSASYNASGSNTYTISTTGANFKNAIAQTNP